MLTFQEALDWAKERNVVLPEDYVNILDQMIKRKAFTIAGVSSRDQLQLVLDSLSEMLADGGTWEDWVKKVTSKEIALDLPMPRLDNIYRTNLQIHYNHGHWVQQTKHKAERPYLMYDAINDSRVRPNHLALDNVIRHIDDPFWQTYYPPIGFRCRCGTISLTEKQALKRGGVSRVPEDGWPKLDKGWEPGSAQDPEKMMKKYQEPKEGGSAVLQDGLKKRQITIDMNLK